MRKKGQLEAETRIVRLPHPEGVAPKDQEPLWEPERLTLDGTEWTPGHWALIVWEATPIPVRIPVTQEALADKLGVTTRSFYNWRKLPRFWEQVRHITRTYLQVDLPSIYYALADQAKKGSYPHIKLVLELLGEYTEHYDVTSGSKPFAIQTYEYGAATAPLTGGPTSDNTPSG